MLLCPSLSVFLFPSSHELGEAKIADAFLHISPDAAASASLAQVGLQVLCSCLHSSGAGPVLSAIDPHPEQSREDHRRVLLPMASAFPPVARVGCLSALTAGAQGHAARWPHRCGEGAARGPASGDPCGHGDLPIPRGARTHTRRVIFPSSYVPHAAPRLCSNCVCVRLLSITTDRCARGGGRRRTDPRPPMGR